MYAKSTCLIMMLKSSTSLVNFCLLVLLIIKRGVMKYILIYQLCIKTFHSGHRGDLGQCKKHVRYIKGKLVFIQEIKTYLTSNVWYGPN